MATDLSRLPANMWQGLAVAAEVFNRRGVHYALIGGVATGYRARPRSTKDLDFILTVPQIALPGLLEELQTRGFEFDTVPVIRQWTQEHMAVLAFAGSRIDWLKPVIPLYQHIVDRATMETVQGAEVRIATAEGLILTKLIAFRVQDQADVASLLAVNRGALDLDYIRREWQTVGDLDDSRMLKFEEMVKEYYQVV